MITRPLDLAAHLTPPTRAWDALFYVNLCTLAVFFSLFGSRFILAPGIAVDFVLPTADNEESSLRLSDIVITVDATDRAIVSGQNLDFKELRIWLKQQVTNPIKGGHRLLVKASGTLPASDLAKIYNMASEAGFSGVLIATDDRNATVPRKMLPR
jgi:biopolymer transport protein ExbD